MAKILLVEDDLAVADAIADALESESNVVEHVACGLEGAQRLKLYQYDMAILDWDLPKKTGVDICSEYRNHGGTMPILMLTGKTSVEDEARQTADEIGVYDHQRGARIGEHMGELARQGGARGVDAGGSGPCPTGCPSAASPATSRRRCSARPASPRA